MMEKTIEDKALEVFAKNRAQAKKYHYDVDCWIDWFRMGYNQCLEDLQSEKENEAKYKIDKKTKLNEK